MINPLNAELNPIYHLLTLLGAHQIFLVSGLRCCATNRKVTGSIPDGVIGIFH